MAYIGVSPQFGVRRKHTYIVSGSSTDTFSGAGAEGATLSYTDSNFVDVYQNGVKLGDDDYTSTSGTSIVLGTIASDGDIVEIIVFDAFSVADTVSKADGGTFDNAVTITTDDNNAQLTLVSTDADASRGAILAINRNSASPADNDIAGTIKFNAKNDAAEDIELFEINTTITDASDGTEDAKMTINGIIGGASTNRVNLNNTETVFNEDGVDLDFRVEADSETHALFVQAGSGGVGIGNNSPNSFGANTDNLVIGTTSGENGMTIVSGTANSGRIQFADNTSDPFRGAIEYAHGSTDAMIFYTAGSERMRIRSGGFVAINTTGGSAQLQVLASSGEIVYFQNSSGTGAKLTAGNQSFSAVSDENKKENIVELDKQESYDNIKNIRAVTYKFKDIEVTDDDGKKTTYKDDISRIGFIAQDWETKYSQLVNTDDEGVKSLLYTETTPVLLSALQKAQEKIEALEARITALEGK